MRGIIIGRMDTRAVFQQKVGTLNEFNENKQEWENLPNPLGWVYVVPRAGREVFAADQIHERQYASIYTRYRTDIKAEMRVGFNGEAWRIVNVLVPAGFRKTMLEIIVELDPEFDSNEFTDEFSTEFVA